jgi:four helix bundle protein
VSDFKKLRVWRNAHALMLNVRRTARTIRPSEYSDLRSQMTRAAMSIAANIVEGRGKQSEAEFARFVDIAKGSAAELEYHLIAARDLDAITQSDFHSLRDQVEEVAKMLRGLSDCLRASIDESTARKKSQGLSAKRRASGVERKARSVAVSDRSKKK